MISVSLVFNENLIRQVKRSLVCSEFALNRLHRMHAFLAISKYKHWTKRTKHNWSISFLSRDILYATLTQKITFFSQRQHSRDALLRMRDRGRVENWMHVIQCDVDLTSGNFTLTSKFIFTARRMKTNFVAWNAFASFINIFRGESSLPDFYLALPQARTEHLAITSHKCFCASPTECSGISELAMPCDAMEKSTRQRRDESEAFSNQQPTSSNICYVHNTRARASKRQSPYVATAHMEIAWLQN